MSQPPRYYRKLIRIRAEDSPNVRYALTQLDRGLVPDNREIVPGVLSWEEYVKRRELWDTVRQCVGLDARFWEGADLLLFPPDWLNRAEERDRILRRSRIQRVGRGLGCDPGEGTAETSWTAVDEHGVIEQVSYPTPNTNGLAGITIAFGRKHGIPPERWMIDIGGGGKQLADRLRGMESQDVPEGFQVQTVGFGDSVKMTPHRGLTTIEEKVGYSEERYTYINCRAEMYWQLRLLLDPSREEEGLDVFAIPPEYSELRRQLAPMPLLYTNEGRIKMLPKTKRNPNSKEKTLQDILGCSPDRADSLVLAVRAMVHEMRTVEAGAA